MRHPLLFCPCQIPEGLTLTPCRCSCFWCFACCQGQGEKQDATKAHRRRGTPLACVTPCQDTTSTWTRLDLDGASSRRSAATDACVCGLPASPLALPTGSGPGPSRHWEGLLIDKFGLEGSMATHSRRRVFCRRTRSSASALAPLLVQDWQFRTHPSRRPRCSTWRPATLLRSQTFWVSGQVRARARRAPDLSGFLEWLVSRLRRCQAQHVPRWTSTCALEPSPQGPVDAQTRPRSQGLPQPPWM